MKRALLLLSFLGFLLAMDFAFPYEPPTSDCDQVNPAIENIAQNVNPIYVEQGARFESGAAYVPNQERDFAKENLQPIEEDFPLELYLEGNELGEIEPCLNCHVDFRKGQVERAAFARMKEADFRPRKPPLICSGKRWLNQRKRKP